MKEWHKAPLYQIRAEAFSTTAGEPRLVLMLHIELHRNSIYTYLRRTRYPLDIQGSDELLYGTLLSLHQHGSPTGDPGRSRLQDTIIG